MALRTPPAGGDLVLEIRGAGQQEREGLIGEPAQDDEDGDYLKLDDPLKAFFGQGLPVNVLVVCVILTSLYNHKGAGILSSLFSGISVACLVACFVLHLAAMVVTLKVTVRCWLAYLSVILRIVATTFLLLFMDTVRHLVVILPLSLVVFVLLGSFFVQQVTDAANKDIRPGLYWLGHKEELKLRFDVSSQVVTFAFAGMLGTVLGYVKSSSEQLLLSGRGYMAPDCFLLYSLDLGLLVQLLSTVAPYIRNMNTRERMATVYLRMVAYASLMFLVLASVMAAEEILHEWVFITCFIIVIVPVLCFWLERTNGPYWFKDRGNGLLRRCFMSIREEQGDDDKATQFILAYFILLFAALMASNSKYSSMRGTAVSLSGWFKCSVLLELYGVLSCAVRLVLFSEMPQMKSLAFPKMVWHLSVIATVVITIILAVVIWILESTF